MKLTEGDKEILLELGHPERDLRQIEEALGKTIYTFNVKGAGSKRISADVALQLLGRRAFLSGISRSAFHHTAEREIGETTNSVSFDSGLLFKQPK